MQHTSKFEEKEPKSARFGKGFYIALSLCLITIAGIALVMFLGEDTPPLDTGESTTGTTTATAATTAKPVAGVATGVPDTRTTTTTASVQTTVTTTTSADPLFVLPASNVIAREYSEQLIFSETLGEWRTHNGVDFEAEEGTAVKAIADGTVLAVEYDPLWGDIIRIEHGDKLIASYCGVKASGITAGKSVKIGEMIGAVSLVPAEITDKPHLHLEIVVNGRFLDPMTLIQGATSGK